MLRDHLGTITHLKTGSTVTEYSFDAWGHRDKDNWGYTLGGEPDLFAGRGFTGHEYLADFKLYNMNGRFYDPVVGRFLSPDPYVQMPDFSQNFNRYSYALNNPLVYTDPSGELFGIDDLIIVGVVVLTSSAINVATHWQDIKENGGWFSNKFWGYAGLGAVNGVGILTGQPWIMATTAAIQSGGNSWIDDGKLTFNEGLQAVFDGAVSFGSAKLTLPNSGKTPLGFKYSPKNLNLSDNFLKRTLIKQGWGERLSSFLGGQLIDYPYTFATSSIRYLGFGEGDFDHRLDNWYRAGLQTANAQFIMNGALDAGFYSIQKQIELFRIDKAQQNIYMEIDRGNTNWFNDLQNTMFTPAFPVIPHLNLLPYTDPGSLIINPIKY